MTGRDVLPIDGRSLRCQDVVRASRRATSVSLAPDAEREVVRANQVADELSRDPAGLRPHHRGRRQPRRGGDQQRSR